MNQEVKVLLCTGEMNAGGAETLIMELLRQQTGAVEYTMLIHYAGEKKQGVFDEEIRSLGVQMLYIPSVGSAGQKEYTRLLGKINREYGPFDVIHSHLNGIGGAIMKAAKEVGIPSRVVHCHADITFKGNVVSRAKNEALLQLMRKYIDKYANHFWACSPAAAERLFYKKQLSKAVIIPNVIDAEKYLSTSESAARAKQKFSLEKKKVIGAVGRIAPIKNYELVIRLLKELNRQGKEYTFVCFGRVVDEAYYNSLVALAKELGVEKQVQFLGNSTAVAEDIHCFDIAVMPSHSEGFGMAAIEAQAAGIPTVVSTGVPQIVDVKAGLIQFADAADIAAWVSAVEVAEHCLLVSSQTILECFDNSGFNSKTMAKQIEQKYIAMAKEDT